MKILIRICLVLAVAVRAAGAGSLPRSAPEAQGVPSTAMLALVNSLDQQIEGMHSLMVVRHGHVIAEGWWSPYAADHNHALCSLSKLCAYETPFQTTFTLKFEGEQVTLNSEANVSFGPTKQPQLAGRAE